MAKWLTGDEQTAFVRKITPQCHEMTRRDPKSQSAKKMAEMLDRHSRGQLGLTVAEVSGASPVVPAPGVSKPTDFEMDSAASEMGASHGHGAANGDSSTAQHAIDQ
jgi:hypothetical protein